MKKDIVLVDLLMLVVFAGMIIGKLLKLPFVEKFQVVFIVLTIIHIVQHWKIILQLCKNLFK